MRLTGGEESPQGKGKERKGKGRDELNGEGTEHWAAATGQNYLLRAWYIPLRFTSMYCKGTNTPTYAV